MKRNLFLFLCALLTNVSVWAQASYNHTYKEGATVAAGGDYFLYNIEAGQFLTNGLNWGTRATVDNSGRVLTLSTNGSGYNIRTEHISLNGLSNGAAGYLTTNGYVDTGSSDAAWVFTPVSVDGYTNAYTIKNSETQYLVYNVDDGCAVNVTSSTNSNASYWLLIPKSQREEAGDYSHYLINTQMNAAWERKAWSGSLANEDAVIAVGGLATNRCAEKYHVVKDIYQQISANLPTGRYKVYVQGFYRADGSGDAPYLYANSDQQSMSLLANGENNMNAASTSFTNGLYETSVETTVTDGSLKVGINITSSSQWVIFDNFVLDYLGAAEDISVYIEAYHNALTAAQGVDQTAPMQASLLQALQTAINTYGTGVDETSKESLQEAYDALNTAKVNAAASITAYANAKAYLDETEGILANTNVYTSEAYANYYGTPKAKYDAATLTNEEANALEKIGTGWHSSNTISDILLSSWTIGGTQAHAFETSLYINTWSVEGNTDGSDFVTPFFEYWTSDAASLGATTLVSTITGLTPNTTYSFTIRGRVRQANNATKVANGITMQVGNGTAVDISAGAQFGTGQFYIGNFSAVGETDDNGTLTCTITVAANSNISWLSFYNCKYTEGEDLSAYIADYEFALSTAQTNLSSSTYANVTGKERADLSAAVSTYAEVDETSKSDLIEAKAALESATGVFTSAASVYNAFAELNATVASTLGVTLPTITSTTTAADLDVESYIVAEYTAAKAYSHDMTSSLGEWTNAPGTNKGESWDGTTTDTYYDLYNSAARAMTQTVTLPAGDYALIAKGRASVNGKLTLSDGTETITYAHKSSVGRGIATDGTPAYGDGYEYANNGAGRGWEYRVFTFTSDGKTAKTLTFNWTTASSNWVGLDDIELRANLDNATAEDYAALSQAITDAEENTLGFLAGQYAPYNNVAALTALNAAKAIGQTVDNARDIVLNATSALENATWTANTKEENAIFDGSFEYDYSGQSGNVNPIGWKKTASSGDDGYNVRYMSGESAHPGLAATSSKTALFTKTSAFYGYSEGYSMPLEANTVYKLKFVYGGWGDCKKDGYVQVLDPDGNTLVISESERLPLDAVDAETNTGSWKSYEAYFKTAAAGNYVLGLRKDNESVQSQYVYGDIELKTAPAVEVSMQVSATAKMGTFCAPFDVTIPEGVSAYVAEKSEEGDWLSLTAVNGTIEAGTPVILEAEEKVDETLSDVPAVLAPANDDVLQGVFSMTTISAGGEDYKNYIMQYKNEKTAFFIVSYDVQVGANRCYLQLESNSGEEAPARIAIGREDETGIKSLEQIENEAQTKKDGKYLVGGRIVVVKNGKVYNVSGAIEK